MTLHEYAYLEYLNPDDPTSRRESAPKIAPPEARAAIADRVHNALTAYRKDHGADPETVVVPLDLLRAMGYPSHIWGRPLTVKDRMLVLDNEGTDVEQLPGVTTYTLREAVTPTVWKSADRDALLDFLKHKYARRAREDGYAVLEAPSVQYEPEPAPPLTDSRLAIGRLTLTGRVARRFDAEDEEQEGSA